MRLHVRSLAPAAALGLLAACAAPRGTAESPVVTRLDLPGSRAVDDDALRAGLATQAPDCFAGFLFCDYGRLDPDALANDRRRVEAYYRTRGYYLAQAEPPAVQLDAKSRARVTMAVHEGAPVRVSKVVLVGLDVAPEARPKKLPLAAGDVFTEAAYDEARGALLHALRTNGYASAEVAQAAQVLPDEGTAEVTYTVTAGPRYRFGRIFVAGTASAPRDLIADQAAGEARPGDWFDEGKLARVQARVFELGAFAGVRVARGSPDPQRLTVPIVVSVREAPFRTLRLGPGLGFQASRWDAQGQATWTHRNFAGGLRKLQVESRAGYAWLPNPLKSKREDVVGQLAVELAQPALFARTVDGLARVELERGLEDAYGFWSERLKLAAPIRLAPRWTLTPSYNLEVYQLHQVVQSSTATTRPPQFSNCPSGVCLLSYLEQRLAWDGRNDPINTRRGLYAALSVQEGFHVGGNGYDYLRLLPEVRAYLPVAGAVLAARARVGLLVPVKETGSAPVVALFTSGGAQSVRGYGQGRLSPMSLQDGRWVPTGGNGLMDATVEARLPVTGDVGMALFVDAGNVAPASALPTEYLRAFDLTQLQLAAGTGLRYRTPFGPLRLDFAMRLPTDWSPGTSWDHRFPTVPGDSGHREPWAALHVTLGEAF